MDTVLDKYDLDRFPEEDLLESCLTEQKEVDRLLNKDGAK